MKKILSVSVDTLTRNKISSLLTEHKHAGDFDILTAESLQESDTILKKTKIDIVIIDLSAPFPNDLASLKTITENNRRIPFIVMTGFEASEIESTIKSNGTIRCLEKPVDFKELADKMVAEMAGGIGGVFHGISLATFLQMSEMEGTSCTLKVKAVEQKEGLLHLQNGALVAAVTETVSGEEAVYEILGWNSPTIEIENPDPDITREITKPLMSLLMEGTRRKDEKAGKIVHKSGKIVYKPLRTESSSETQADTEKEKAAAAAENEKLAAEKKKIAAAEKEKAAAAAENEKAAAAAENEKLAAEKKKIAAAEKEKAAARERLDGLAAEKAEKARTESDQVSAVEEPRATENISSWRKSRKVRYGIIAGIGGFVCLGLFVFIVLNSGERSPGEDMINPLPSGTTEAVRVKLPGAGNTGTVKSLPTGKNDGTPGKIDTSDEYYSHLVDLVREPLSYLSPEYITGLLNDAIAQGNFDITTKITPLLPPELWRKIMENATPSEVGNVLIHYPPELLLNFLDTFDDDQLTKVMEQMSSRMTTEEVGKLFNLSNPEELAKITTKYPPARLMEAADKIDQQAVLRLVESITNKITPDQVIQLMDATGPMYLAEIALHFPPEMAATVLTKMGSRQDRKKFAAQIGERITPEQIARLMEKADPEYLAAIVSPCPWEVIDTVLARMGPDRLARMALEFPPELGIRTLNKLNGAQARTLAAHIGRSWTAKQITLSGADATYVAMIVFDSPLEVVGAVRHKLNDAQLQELIKIAAKKMGSGDPRAMKIFSQLVR